MKIIFLSAILSAILSAYILWVWHAWKRPFDLCDIEDGDEDMFDRY